MGFPIQGLRHVLSHGRLGRIGPLGIQVQIEASAPAILRAGTWHSRSGSSLTSTLQRGLRGHLHEVLLLLKNASTPLHRPKETWPGFEYLASPDRHGQFRPSALARPDPTEWLYPG